MVGGGRVEKQDKQKKNVIFTFFQIKYIKLDFKIVRKRICKTHQPGLCL